MQKHHCVCSCFEVARTVGTVHFLHCHSNQAREINQHYCFQVHNNIAIVMFEATISITTHCAPTHSTNLPTNLILALLFLVSCVSMSLICVEEATSRNDATAFDTRHYVVTILSRNRMPHKKQFYISLLLLFALFRKLLGGSTSRIVIRFTVSSYTC